MKKLSLTLASLAIVILFSFSFSYSDEKNIIKGNAIVVDGDTIKINGKKIRFGGIDAPESYFKGKKQTCIENNKEVFCGQIYRGWAQAKTRPGISGFRRGWLEKVAAMAFPSRNRRWRIDWKLIHFDAAGTDSKRELITKGPKEVF